MSLAIVAASQYFGMTKGVCCIVGYVASLMFVNSDEGGGKSVCSIFLTLAPPVWPRCLAPARRTAHRRISIIPKLVSRYRYPRFQVNVMAVKIFLLIWTRATIDQNARHDGVPGTYLDIVQVINYVAIHWAAEKLVLYQFKMTTIVRTKLHYSVVSPSRLS